MKKTAIITGGATGIGRATAEWLARDGMNIVIGDINMPGAEDTAKSILNTTDSNAVAINTDVGEPQEVKRLIDVAVDRFARIDVLINCAADLSQLPTDLDVVGTDLAVFDRTYQVNFRGAVAGCKYAIPEMIKTGGGSIVNVSSATSLQGDKERVAYSSLTAATNQLTRSIAVRFGKDNIRCNTVCPGLILNNDAMLHPPEEMKSEFLKAIASPELGVSSNAAELIGFLASDRAQYITGELISIDGGFTKRVPYYFSLKGPE